MSYMYIFSLNIDEIVGDMMLRHESSPIAFHNINQMMELPVSITTMLDPHCESKITRIMSHSALEHRISQEPRGPAAT